MGKKKKSYQNIELFGGTIDIEFDETALLRFRTNKRICQLIFAKMSFLWTDETAKTFISI